MIGKQVRSAPLSDEYACRTKSHRSLRDLSFFKRIPGNKLPGYDHLVPTGQPTSPRVYTFSTLHDKRSFQIEDSLPDVASRSFRRRGRSRENEDDFFPLRRQATINRKGDSGNEARGGGA